VNVRGVRFPIAASAVSPTDGDARGRHLVERLLNVLGR
jgi:hypothetical protein